MKRGERERSLLSSLLFFCDLFFFLSSSNIIITKIISSFFSFIKEERKKERKKREKMRGDGEEEIAFSVSDLSSSLSSSSLSSSSSSTTTTTQRNVSVIKGEESFKKKLDETKGKQLVVVNFGASWCKHCHKLSPSVFDEAEKYPNSEFIFTDVDLLPETAKFMRWTPTVGIYKFGRKVDEIEQCKIRQLKDRVWLWSDLKETRFESRG
jgi:thioredoxin 1